jgi:FkbM family methyltransferase
MRCIVRGEDMKIRSGLSWYYGNYGIRGVLAISAYRLLGRPKQISVRPPGTRNRVRLRIKTSDEAAYRETLLHSQYDFDLPFRPLTIIDAGANIGTASIYFARRYPHARIVAIEPERSNFALLSRNVAPYPAITPLCAALWSRDGEIGLGHPSPAEEAHLKWAFVTREGSDERVRAVTLGTLMKEMKMSSVDLLKIDIEGAEKEVFEACDWIDAVRCIMIELHDGLKPGCSHAVNSAARGFSQLKRGEVTLYLRAPPVATSGQDRSAAKDLT